MGFFDFYPYTNWHNVNLDWVLQRVKEWGQMVEDNNTRFENLLEANENFKNYVTSYLENLDVQLEINNKLDDMLADGTLAQYFQPYISSSVTTWLDENITEPEGVIIDSSLTVSGACADAKTVGDYIFPLNRIRPIVNSLGFDRINLYDITTVKDNIAIWMDGNEHENTGTCCSDYIDIAEYEKIKVFGTTLIAFYTNSKTFISANNTEGDTRFTERTFNTPLNARYMRISTRLGYKSDVYVGLGNYNLNYYNKEKISILCVGNSLTHDAMSYVPYVLRTLFPELNFEIHLYVNGGLILNSQYNRFVNNTPAAQYSIATNCETWKTFWSVYTMQDVLSTYKFDIVCLQEYFTSRNDFTQSDLENGWEACVNYITENYAFDNSLKFVSLMPAPVRNNWESQTLHYDTETVYNATVKAMKMFLSDTVCENIIPCGMGIYEAMQTQLDLLGDKLHLSQDGLHCQEGIPCLLQAYIAVLFILKCVSQKNSIYASKIKITTAIYETLNVPGNNLGTGVITGTTEENLLAQKIAVMCNKEMIKWYSE